MIVENQSNLKVHFAGLENYDFAQTMIGLAGINYALFTCWPFLFPKLGIKAASYTDDVRVIKYLEGATRHTIMDSGLFTLMFGAHKGKKDLKFIRQWQELIIEFVREQDYRGTMVEVDCQKVLGVKNAWKFRQELSEALPNRIINVFHIEDGEKGLDRLIEYSDYIAISLPELRKEKKKTYAESLANYIKNKKPEIDIHLLGCTENKLLKNLSFCTSSDSTSWQQVNRYGVVKFHNGQNTKSAKTRHFEPKLDAEYDKQIIKVLKSINREPTDKRIAYLKNYLHAGKLLKNQYSIHAGSQH